MDGYKRRLNASIQLKLSLALSLAIVFIAILAGIFSFASAFDEAQELQDDSLRQVAAPKAATMKIHASSFSI